MWPDRRILDLFNIQLPIITGANGWGEFVRDGGRRLGTLSLLKKLPHEMTQE